MTASVAYQKWKGIYGPTNWRNKTVGYRETAVGIVVLLDNGTGIPYPYKYEERTPLLAQ